MAFNGQIDQAPNLTLLKLLGVDASGRAGLAATDVFAPASSGAKAESSLQPTDPNGVANTLAALDSASMYALISTLLAALPTSMPGTVGAFWNNGGVLSQVQP